jgi:hypothetical protein
MIDYILNFLSQFSPVTLYYFTVVLLVAFASGLVMLGRKGRG